MNNTESKSNIYIYKSLAEAARARSERLHSNVKVFSVNRTDVRNPQLKRAELYAQYLLANRRY